MGGSGMSSGRRQQPAIVKSRKIADEHERLGLPLRCLPLVLPKMTIDR
jgi:hypothetical protein